MTFVTRPGTSAGGPCADPASRGDGGAYPCLTDALAQSPAPECVARSCYWDPIFAKPAAKLLPGEYFVSTRDMLLVTVLGSCVAACIRDTRTGVGGMNHFMLPDCDPANDEPYGKAARYGVYAMELLINHLLKLGAGRAHLEAKVFGGGAVLPGLTQARVGERNSAFVLDFLNTEQIAITARDLNGSLPRKVYFSPQSGRVMIKRLQAVRNDVLLVREADYRCRLGQAVADGAIELFD